MLELELDKITGMMVRCKTEDLMIVHEVLIDLTYKLAVVDDSDIVLDIGANIGAAAIFFAAQGARVVAYEPEPQNCEVARINIARKGYESGITLFEEAIVPANAIENGNTQLWVARAKNKACHSTFKKAGYDLTWARGEDLFSALNRHKPTVVKCDIEGGEYGLPWEVIPPSVRMLIIELHNYRKLWKLESGPKLIEQIVKMGFKQISPKKWSGGTSFPIVFVWKRV